MFRFVPPAGIPINLSDLVSALGSRGVGGSQAGRFAEQIADTARSNHACHFNSGRTALAVVLRSLAGLSGKDRDEVVMPAYSCFSVASAIVRAGLKIKLCDIDESTLDYDYDRLRELDLSRTLAVVGCSLFGLICDWDKLRSIVNGRSPFLIDDAAQSFGLSHGGSASGMFGDVGFFSFGRGKNLTTYSGGVAVTGDDTIGKAIEKSASESCRRPDTDDISVVFKLAAYSLFLRPNLYWIPNSLPFLGLGETVFDPDFPMERLSEFRGRLGVMLLPMTDQLNGARERNSRSLMNGLGKLPGLSIPGADRDETIPYLRLPVLLETADLRNKVVRSLRRKGIGASPMYPSPIDEIPGIDAHLDSTGGKFPGARGVSDRLLTLPTHPYVTESDISTIVNTMTSMLSKGDR